MKTNSTLTIKSTLLLCAALLLSNLAQAQLGSRSVSGLSAQSAIDEPLPLEQAFPFFVSVVSPGKYSVVWDLPPAHYLYRHAFDFTLSQTSESEELEVDFSLPDGLKKTDQFFGDIEAYYGPLTVELSLNTVPGREANINIYYQGCADWGFCYPPQRFEFPLNP